MKAKLQNKLDQARKDKKHYKKLHFAKPELNDVENMMHRYEGLCMGLELALFLLDNPDYEPPKKS